MKVILTGGGTGGHIYPAIAIGDEIKRRYPDAQILYVGTEKGLEKELAPSAGYEIRFIHASGLNRRNLLKNVETVRTVLKGEEEARQILKEFRPDAVIGTGGFVCGPMVREAQRKRIPTYLHEQNAFAGVTNKLLARHADTVFCAFEEAEAFFKDAKRTQVVGNPVRREFAEADRNACREALGLNDDELAVLCFGGSLGAQAVNRTITDALGHLYHGGFAETFGARQKHVRVFYATGRTYHAEFKSKLDSLQVPYISMEEYQKVCKTDALTVGDGVTPVCLMAYIEKMYELLPAMDLVISRSGALTLSEITVTGRASILIPSPNVTANHQYFNAKAVADKGGAALIEEKELTAEGLERKMAELLCDDEKRRKMEACSKACGITDAAERIVTGMGW